MNRIRVGLVCFSVAFGATAQQDRRLEPSDPAKLPLRLRSSLDQMRKRYASGMFVILKHYSSKGMEKEGSDTKSGDVYLTRYFQDIRADRDSRAAEEWEFLPPYPAALGKVMTALQADERITSEMAAAIGQLLDRVHPDVIYRYNDGLLCEWRVAESRSGPRWCVVQRDPLSRVVHSDYLKLVGWDCAYGWGWDTEFGYEACATEGDTVRIVCRSDTALAPSPGPQNYVRRDFTLTPNGHCFQAVRFGDVLDATDTKSTLVSELVVPSGHLRKEGPPTLAVSISMRPPEGGLKVNPGIHHNLVEFRALSEASRARLADELTPMTDYEDVDAPMLIEKPGFEGLRDAIAGGNADEEKANMLFLSIGAGLALLGALLVWRGRRVSAA